jgi:hypothetical protein
MLDKGHIVYSESIILYKRKKEKSMYLHLDPVLGLVVGTTAAQNNFVNL